ncbi:MAG: hypothetical protein IJZ28_03965 [Clostridia bacterium]|nr:hypothetical protein [Clostridia bacterium]MBQ8772338.1 hypothetical protein [Clostridia bacterium]
MITSAEKVVVERFQQLRIPSFYKVDDTDNLLYVEHVNYDLCEMLLRSKKVSKEYVQNEIEEYSAFLSQSSILNFDDDEKEYFKLLIEVVNIFIIHNL